MTNETKVGHTPGPWRADGPWIEASNGDLVADANPDEGPAKGRDDLFYADTAIQANARVLAAAPDLLAVLRELLPAIEHSGVGYSHIPSELRQKARAAIARATEG